MSVTTSAERSNPHLTHCCKRHGCKYDDSNCIVTTGGQKQVYPCEYCESPRELKAQIAKLVSELEWSEQVYARPGS